MGREISNETRMSDRVIADFLNLFGIRLSLYNFSKEFAQGMLKYLRFLIEELNPSTLCRGEAEMYLRLNVPEYLAI